MLKSIFKKENQSYIIFMIVIIAVILFAVSSSKKPLGNIVNIVTTATFPQPLVTSTSSAIVQGQNIAAVGLSRVLLPDGSVIIMEANSEIEILSMRSSSTEAGGNEILLIEGKVLIEANLMEGEWFRVISPDGSISQVTGSSMVVIYDLSTGEFTVACLEGECQAGPDLENLFDVPIDQFYVLGTDGELHGPFEIETEEEAFEIIGAVQTQEAEPTATPTPSETPSEEPGGVSDADATATAACADFNSQFPLTPCP